MNVYPAVDVLDGSCVQLVQGKRDRATVYGTPLECACRWIGQGARALHIINLNGAFGDAVANAREIRELIAETGVEVQLGGGIRSIEDADEWLSLGVERVILGTLATRTPGAVTELADRHGSSAVMASIDARGGDVVVEGWERSAGDYLAWAERFEQLGAGSLLFTNVDVEGLCQGIAPDPVRRVTERVRIPVVAAGGISSTEDVSTLAAMGVYGIVLGSALYRGTIDFQAALRAAGAGG
ncbi:MAG: 1-(5-phosphoribosyl)-5-[(5-phosphoribosylamino)methylideneamino]imidazole-4-carboxamide isomerase [Methanomicrobiaceae archaeon]|nr:1-(5-phosphoribosyl)-5-[(5-phosphoribosylamino)methylideneamino]imidazole-4-carboxamide isomerase [Methanomicrobiaceae archaeon]